MIVDRTTKAILKHANSNKPSKLQQLQSEFEEYKRNNDVKFSAITELLRENENLKYQNENQAKEVMWLYGKLNMISDVVQAGRSEMKQFYKG